MDWARAGGESAGRGAAWIRRAPVKVPPGRPPPPVPASLPGLLAGSSAHVPRIMSCRPFALACVAPERNGFRCQRSRGETRPLALQVPTGPGRNFSRQPSSEGAWEAHGAQGPVFIFFGWKASGGFCEGVFFLLARTKCVSHLSSTPTGYLHLT